MNKQEAKLKLKNEKWYNRLVDDCTMILFNMKKRELEFKTDIIRMKYSLGQRITKDERYLNRKYGDRWCPLLAKDLKISESDLYYCVQTAEKFTPKNLEKILHRGGELAWRKFREEYLPEHEETKMIPLPEGKFDVIYADPPWAFDVESPAESKVETHYPTMELMGICNIPDLQDRLADDAVLLLWCPQELIKKGLNVMSSWGFEFRTHAVWRKDKKGMGYWFRSIHEDLLLGIKGNFPTPKPENRYDSVIDARRTSHSKKPMEFYEIIERMFPKRKYLELFARKCDREGWTAWGLET